MPDAEILICSASRKHRLIHIQGLSAHKSTAHLRIISVGAGPKFCDCRDSRVEGLGDLTGEWKKSAANRGAPPSEPAATQADPRRAIQGAGPAPDNTKFNDVQRWSPMFTQEKQGRPLQFRELGASLHCPLTSPGCWGFRVTRAQVGLPWGPKPGRT